MARQRLKSPQSLSSTYTHPPHHGYPKVMVMNDQLTSLSFQANQPSHSWNKAISNFDLETSRSWSLVWSCGKTIQSTQYLIDLLSFRFTSIRNNSRDTAILKFDLEKFMVRAMGEVKGQGHSSHLVSNWCTCLFHINRTNHSWDMLDCSMLLLARHLADVSCYIGPSMPFGICMEIHTKIVQKRKKKRSRDYGIPRQPHVY